ncbi:hypothetical protein E6O75_ATG01375 [Venturia nashicola]|uniref:Uncharacterized protein n=1 Tax=Venturia nashicola TaxID=86259 RepID=A0A4Z1PBZ0_9PEZI|nr:hypothetical protein E6O75_ATG01375 [Venturia nashicola]
MYKFSKLWKRLSTSLPSRKRKSKEEYSTKEINDEAPKVALRLPSIIFVSEKDDTVATPKPEITESLPRHMEKRGGSISSQNRPSCHSTQHHEQILTPPHPSPAVKEEESHQFHPELESRPVSQIPQEPSPRSLLLEIKSDITSISHKIDTLAYESTRRRIDLGLVKMETLQTLLERSNEETRAFRTVGVAEIERRVATQAEGMESRLLQKIERASWYGVGGKGEGEGEV